MSESRDEHGAGMTRGSHGRDGGSRGRGLGRTLTLALASALAVLLLAAPAGAAKPHNTYLALGDSLAFGYSQAVFNRLLPTGENPAEFDNGYANDFVQALRASQPGLQLVNDGCPGETTESFIDGPCRYGLAYPLHHPYSGGPTSSQLSDALAYIGAHPGTVSPITLDIGANDALAMVEGVCDLKAGCITVHAQALLRQVSVNLRSILAQLRAAAPQAQMIVLGVYNPLGSSIPSGYMLSELLNTVMAEAAATVGARFANPLPVFNPPGALERPTLCKLTHVCGSLADIHPTDLGYEVLAGLIEQQYQSF